MPNAVRWIAPLCVFGLVLAACGSDDKSLSKAEFVTQANAICTQGNKDSDVIAKDLPKNATAQQIADLYLDRQIPVFYDELDQLEKLKAPKADRETVKAIFEDARNEGKAFAAKLKADPQGVLSGPADPFKHSEDEALAYGLTVCGSSN